MVSSPVAGETYDDAYVAANSLAISGTNNAISTYVSASNSLVLYANCDAAANFNAGQGYSVRREMVKVQEISLLQELKYSKV